jgi:hypothetical protein
MNWFVTKSLQQVIIATIQAASKILNYFFYLLSTNQHTPERIFSDGSLGSKTCYSPHSYLYTAVKLLPSHIPHTLIGNGLRLGLKIVTYRSCDISYTTPNSKYVGYGLKIITCIMFRATTTNT